MDKTTTSHYLVPKNETGTSQDFSYSIVAPTVEEALDWFIEAKVQLLDIGTWKNYFSPAGPDFVLTNVTGSIIRRPARKANYIRADIAGTGEKANNEYGWFYIEAIEYDDYPDEDKETIAMYIRHSVNPVDFQKGTTQIFNEEATITFVVERKGTALNTTVHVRNVINAKGKERKMEFSLLTNQQWKMLLKGITDPPAQL